MDVARLGQRQRVAIVLAQNCLPVHGVRRAVDGPLGVDVAGVLAAGRHGERPTRRRGRRKLIALAGNYPEIVLLGFFAGHRKLRGPAGVGGFGVHQLLAEARVDLRARDGLPGYAIDNISNDISGRRARDQRHLGDHQQRVGLEAAVSRLQQIEARVELGHGQVVRVGDVRGGHKLAPARDQLGLVQNRNLRKFRLADDAAAALDRALLRSQRMARVVGKLAAEEVADMLPEVGLPVVKLLQPGAFVDLLFAEEARLGPERVQLAQVLHELHGIVDAIDAKLQRVDVVGVEMDLGLLARSEGLAGAQIERNGIAL